MKEDKFHCVIIALLGSAVVGIYAYLGWLIWYWFHIVQSI